MSIIDVVLILFRRRRFPSRKARDEFYGGSDTAMGRADENCVEPWPHRETERFVDFSRLLVRDQDGLGRRPLHFNSPCAALQLLKAVKLQHWRRGLREERGVSAGPRPLEYAMRSAHFYKFKLFM